MAHVLAADIGNTSVKWGGFRAGEMVWTERSLGVTVPDAARGTLGEADVVVGIASVNASRADAVQTHLAEHHRGPILSVGRTVPVPVANRTEHPEQTGVDRLLGVLAATRLKLPDRGAIVVDCGSAVTINVVSADGALLGGAILPGLGLAAGALHEHTDALPRVELDRPCPVLGTTTEGAIRTGVVLGTAGAIERLVRELAGRLDGPPELFLTGSDAPLVGRYLSLPIRHVPHLTLWGIYHACLCAGQG